jgi:hypothetical protein
VPIARYFVTVGSALAVLLMIAGWSLSVQPESFPGRSETIDRAAIRIRSEHKWPEKIVLDTHQPTFSLPSVEAVPPQDLVEHLPGQTVDQASIDPLVEPEPKARPIDTLRPPARVKRRTARAVPSTHVARSRRHNELATLGTREQCCWPDWADRRATSKAASRKRIVRRDSWTDWQFPEIN